MKFVVVIFILLIIFFCFYKFRPIDFLFFKKKFFFYLSKEPIIERIIKKIILRRPFKTQIASRGFASRVMHGVRKNSPSAIPEIEDVKYDLYLVPDGIKTWSIIFFLSTCSPLLALKLFSAHTKSNGFFDLKILFLFSLVFLIIYILTFYLFFRVPVLSQVWGNAIKTYENIILSIPQEIIYTSLARKLFLIFQPKKRKNLKERDLYKNIRPKADQQAMYVCVSRGSLQSSFHELATRDYYDKIVRSKLTDRDGIFLLIIPFTFPIWSSYLFLLLLIVFAIISKKYNVSEFEAKGLHLSIFIWITLSSTYLTWLKNYFSHQKTGEYDLYTNSIKYVPPMIRNSIRGQANLYRRIKEDTSYFTILNFMYFGFLVTYLMLLSIYFDIKTVNPLWY